MNALVVDDELTTRMLLQKLLSKYGNCDAAANGQEGVQAFVNGIKSNNPYNLICLDIMMPGIDGRKVLQTIRTIEQKSKVTESRKAVIFMITAIDDSNVILETVVKYGCNSYLLKPISQPQLLARLKEYNLI